MIVMLAKAAIIAALIGVPPGPGAEPDSREVKTTPAPAATAKPVPRPKRPRLIVSGLATFYCAPSYGSRCTRGYPGGLYAAAGATLRAAIGQRWRGARVRVLSGQRAVWVTLIDTCACPGGRVIDLYGAAFSSLAPLSRGVIRVQVSR